MMHDQSDSRSDGPSRRTIAHAMWTVPVIAVAVAAPAEATSGTPVNGQYPLVIESFIIDVLRPDRDTEFEPDSIAESRRGRTFPGDDFRVVVRVSNPSDVPVPLLAGRISLSFPEALFGKPNHVWPPHGSPGEDPWKWTYSGGGTIVASYGFAIAPHTTARALQVQFERPASTSGWTAADGGTEAGVSAVAGQGDVVDGRSKGFPFPTPVTAAQIYQYVSADYPNASIGESFDWSTVVVNDGPGVLPVGWSVESIAGQESSAWAVVRNAGPADTFETDGWRVDAKLPGAAGAREGDVLWRMTRVDPMPAGTRSTILMPLVADAAAWLNALVHEHVANTAVVSVRPYSDEYETDASIF
jgi:hypothetical protein